MQINNFAGSVRSLNCDGWDLFRGGKIAPAFRLAFRRNYPWGAPRSKSPGMGLKKRQ